jgi:hypothetical protein
MFKLNIQALTTRGNDNLECFGIIVQSTGHSATN